MSVELLNEAFQNFTRASKSLETYYSLLQKKVRYLSTELEKKNQELQSALAEAEKNKDYLNAILYNLEEVIIVLSPDAKVTMMNKSAERLFNISVPDVIGRAFADLDFSITEEHTESILSVKGRRYNIIFSSSPIVDSQNILKGTVILIRDITKLRELEIQHERNQRLIAMGEMAAKIVHEIRNPLCSMELFSSMLENELDEGSQKELAQGVSSGIHSLNTILTNMLLFAKPHKLTMKTMLLDKVVEDSLTFLNPFMKSRDIRIRKSLLEAEIFGDATLLRQVFINIIINAIQSMPDSSELDICIKNKGKLFVAEVRDNGEGIASDDLEKIFNPFFSTKDSGTGLGLTIASKIMQAHNGFITVESEKGKGSTFSLTFLKKGETWNQM
jgi:signal transduction histidine kinase